ncbi:hypothetical protein Tcan_06417 [Toxocara canis]|uniref:Uncharacterized protein n=1 Tax=Toxocara canis TaxID=6265 RepID=A0A0B2W3C1_TOXCA|nr:hypothetical protein Tcan_06417 [Toxocara canis]
MKIFLHQYRTLKNLLSSTTEINKINISFYSIECICGTIKKKKAIICMCARMVLRNVKSIRTSAYRSIMRIETVFRSECDQRSHSLSVSRTKYLLSYSIYGRWLEFVKQMKLFNG